MLDWTLNVLCNGASQRLCYSRRDLKLLNRLRHRHKEPNSFHKGEHMSEKQQAERNFLQMFAAWHWNTQQTYGLLMSISVTSLLTIEADDLLSAVAANQINIVLDYKPRVLPVGSLLPAPLSSSSSGSFSLVPCIHLSQCFWFKHMAVLTKIPSPLHQQAERPRALRTSRQKTQRKPNSFTKHPKLVHSAKPPRKNPPYIWRFAIIKPVFFSSI